VLWGLVGGAFSPSGAQLSGKKKHLSGQAVRYFCQWAKNCPGGGSGFGAGLKFRPSHMVLGVWYEETGPADDRPPARWFDSPSTGGNSLVQAFRPPGARENDRDSGANTCVSFRKKLFRKRRVASWEQIVLPGRHFPSKKTQSAGKCGTRAGSSKTVVFGPPIGLKRGRRFGLCRIFRSAAGHGGGRD